MALPSIVAPHFTTKLPSNGVDIKFRPFLVKEEKLLLIAAESGERKDMIDAICQMLKNCVIEPGFCIFVLRVLEKPHSLN
jgi:hypothetical protein